MRAETHHRLVSAGCWRHLGLLTATLMLCIATGCRDEAPLTIDNLLLDVAAVEGAERISTKSRVNAAEYEGEQIPLAVKSLRRQKIRETAYIKYHLALPERGSYKVKLAIYEDAASQRETWAKRYPASVLVAPLEMRNWGDGGFVIPGKSGAFGMGRLYLQVDGNGDATAVEALLAGFAARARTLQQ